MTRVRVNVQPPSPQVDQPSIRPLTHHEIIRLIGPFTARGRHADMGASDRGRRELRFRPIDHAAGADGRPALREELILNVSDRGGLKLVRVLTPLTETDGATPATVTASGRDAALLLDMIERFPLARHFPPCDGVWVQRSYRLLPRRGTDDPADGVWNTRLVRATAKVVGVQLDLEAEISSLPVKISLKAPPGKRLAIPRDLLAVIGWQWRSVDDYSSHWRSSIRAPRREPHRTADVEDKLDRTVRHLSATLSQTPAAFHKRHLGARWRAAFQGGLATFVALGLIAGTLALTQVPIENEALLQALAFHVPPLMMLLFFFGFDYLPNFETPRVPRALKQASWLVDTHA